MPSIAGAVSYNISLGDFYTENGGYHEDETILSTVKSSRTTTASTPPASTTPTPTNEDDWNNVATTQQSKKNKHKNKHKHKKHKHNNNNNDLVNDVSILFSGWNPPPPNRHMMGDLLYLIIETPTTQHHVTACPLGYFVNSTHQDAFDPTPTTSMATPTAQSSVGSNNNKHNKNPTCLYHDLLDLIKKIYPTFDKMYQQIVKHNQAIEQFSSANSIDMSGVWDALLSVPGTQTEPSHQWNICVPTSSATTQKINDHKKATTTKNNSKHKHHHNNKNKSAYASKKYDHKYDMNRAENDLTDTFGMDERGALRDWNEEYQQSKELPSATLQDRLVRARTLFKHQSDFVQAARAGAEAIVKGHVSSINPMDEPGARVYVFNSIFFSLSVPGAGRDAAHDGTEEAEAMVAAAAKKTNNEDTDAINDPFVVVSSSSSISASSYENASKHDLHGTLAMNRADVPGLHTLATVVLDYMGQRVVAQSIIPGILQGEHNSKLVYGSVDGGVTIASDPVMHELMKQASRHLLVGERTVTPLGYKKGEEETKIPEEPRALQTCAGTDPVPLCGPVDCKGMEGCDGRHYVLDLVNMLPKDTNWMNDMSNIISNAPTLGAATATGTTAAAETSLRAPKGCRETLCLLRPELVRQFANWKISKAKENIIQKHRQKLKEQEMATKKKADEKETDNGEDATKATKVTKATNATDATDALETTKNKGNDISEEQKEQRAKDEAALRASLTQAMVPPLINPNVFSKHAYTESTTASATATDDGAESTTTIAKDEEMIHSICKYLIDYTIPYFLRDIKLANLVIVDGSCLIDSMHQRGINARYLGHMASIWIKDYNMGREHRFKLLQKQQMQQMQQQQGDSASNDKDTKTKEGKDQPMPKIIVSEEDDVRRSYFLRLAEIEMIARTVRHTISTLLRENQNIMVAPGAIIAQFLSRMMTTKGGLGYSSSKDNKNEDKKDNGGEGGDKEHDEEHEDFSAFTTPSFEYTMKVGSKLIPATGREMWNNITKDVYAKFRYHLHVWPGQYEDAETSNRRNSRSSRGSHSILIDVDRIALLRRVCQLLGISIHSKKYNFHSSHPVLSTDIDNMSPILKDGFTKCQMKDIVELIEHGRYCLNKRQLNEAHVALSEALVYLYQAVGVMHEYVAVACSLLAQTYYTGGNIEQAILFEQRALCLYERMGGGNGSGSSSGSSSGYDSYQVMHCHNFLATLYTKLKYGQKMAAKHMVRYLYLQRIACGQYHSDMNNSLIKLGGIYESVGQLVQACKTYQYALNKSIPNTINYATCLHLLAKVFHLSSNHKNALSHVREVSFICFESCGWFLMFTFYFYYLPFIPSSPTGLQNI